MLLNKITIAVLVMLTCLAGCGIGIFTRDGWTVARSQPATARQAPNQAAKSQQSQAQQKSDEEELQGTWKLEKQVWMGKETTPVPGRELTFIRNKMEYQADKYCWDASFKLETVDDMKTLDMFQDGQIMRWLYRLKDGKLTIALQGGYEFSGNERPKDFNSPKDDQRKRVWTFAPASARPKNLPVDDEAVQKAKMRKARARCNANLARLVRAMHRYLENHGHFPPASTTDGAGRPLLSWRVALLPFFGEEKLYKQFHHDEPWNSAHNRKLLAKMPQIYDSVDTPPKNNYKTFYQVFVGEGTVFETGKKISIRNIPDGTVSTIAIVAAGEAVPWTKPVDITYDAAIPLPSLSGGMIADGLFSFATADASAYSAPNTIDGDVLRPFILRDSGQLKDVNSLLK